MFGPLACSSTRLSGLARPGWCCLFPLFFAFWVWKGSLWKFVLFPCVFLCFDIFANTMSVYINFDVFFLCFDEWLKCVVWGLCVCFFLDIFICILFVNDVHVICFCSYASRLCFYIFITKIHESNVVSVFWRVLKCVVWGQCVRVFLAVSCAFCLKMVSRRCAFVPTFYHFVFIFFSTKYVS